MKILFHNRDPKMWLGGDAIQVENTMRSVAKKHSVYFTSEGNHPFNSFDLVHIFHLNFFWTKVMIQRCIQDKKPYIISSIFFPQEYDNKVHEMRRFVTESIKTVALSEAEKKEMVEMLGVDPEKIVVIPNGVDKEVFKKSTRKRKKYVLSVGRLQEMKGPQLILEACKKLNLELVYAGESYNNDFSNNLKSQMTHYENLSPLEMSKLYQECGVFVCSSLSERQSLAVLEASACGAPIVDSVFNRGNTLLKSSKVVDPRNLDELCKAIKLQINKKNTDIVPSWDDVASDLDKIYELI